MSTGIGPAIRIFTTRQFDDKLDYDEDSASTVSLPCSSKIDALVFIELHCREKNQIPLNMSSICITICKINENH